MKLVHDNCEPVPPWYPLPLLPPYEISTNLLVRKDGGLIKLIQTPTGIRVALKDNQGGSKRFYDVDWLWRMSQTKDPVELLKMELVIRRDEVLLRLFARIMSFYSDPENLLTIKGSERVAVLKIAARLLFNKPPVVVRAEPKLISIDTMRKYAEEMRGDDTEEFDAEYTG